jgi:hypothetical protein
MRGWTQAGRFDTEEGSFESRPSGANLQSARFERATPPGTTAWNSTQYNGTPLHSGGPKPILSLAEAIRLALAAGLAEGACLMASDKHHLSQPSKRDPHRCDHPAASEMWTSGGIQ